MARDEPLLRIRVPDDLKARLEAAKDTNRRSLNAEIRMRLEWSFEAGFDGQPTDRMLENEVESLRAELRGMVTKFREEMNDYGRRIAELEAFKPEVGQ